MRIKRKKTIRETGKTRATTTQKMGSTMATRPGWKKTPMGTMTSTMNLTAVIDQVQKPVKLINLITVNL